MRWPRLASDPRIGERDFSSCVYRASRTGGGGSDDALSSTPTEVSLWDILPEHLLDSVIGSMIQGGASDESIADILLREDVSDVSDELSDLDAGDIAAALMHLMDDDTASSPALSRIKNIRKRDSDAVKRKLTFDDDFLKVDAHEK